ncbi:L-glutamate gamma-semialdehyde dehydrogenase [Gordonia sp. FQ]|uniref:L-glutamate gamma-semialdehyde dehydrogenase n=1 Tax=Gordonia sp. FQ TaxID=3446634 RepID=UPI003F879B7E
MTSTTASSPAAPFIPAAGRAYRPGSAERAALDAELTALRGADYDLPVIVAGREVRTGATMPIRLPHDHSTTLGRFHTAGATEVESAIEAAAACAHEWATTPAQERAAIFLRAADLIEQDQWRSRLVAATILELSKTPGQADGDVAEAADFLRANAANLATITAVQPYSPPGVANHVEYRPLEGFVFAVSPFNFTSMNNLAFGPALLGNTVLWKPAESATLVAHLSLQLLREAGLPAGVISLLPGDGRVIGDVALTDPRLSAVHFTGSSATLRHIWKTVGENIENYRDYPRIVGEAGGKDYILAHPTADVAALAVACVRGAFDYQGQKCAAASRLYVPAAMWPDLRARIEEMMSGLVVGDPSAPGTHLGAVISEAQFAKHEAALARARAARCVLAGGETDGERGWFVQPTLLQVDDPMSEFMVDELFAPILAAYVYDDWDAALELAEGSSEYGLTGAVFAADEAVLAHASDVLRYSAGNFYLNDKPTGAIVGQQPFGGGRASGTNDKAGTEWNLIRFLSPRSVKRTYDLDRDTHFPALDA